MIGGLKMFDQAFIASGGTGGPNNATLVAGALPVPDVAFNDVHFGYAAAIGIALFADHARADADPAAACSAGRRPH